MALPTPDNRLKNVFAGYWLMLWNYLVSLVKAIASQQPPTYRAVITSIAAYVGTGTGTLTASVVGVIGAQDGVTLLAGDRVILPLVTGGAGGATAAADTGPYLVVNPGVAVTTKFVLTRPPEFLQGSIIPECITFKIGSEGTNLAGGEWRAFPATATKVVGVDDPHFWPRTQNYTMAIGGAFTPVGFGGVIFYLRTAQGFTAVDTTAAHAFWASTVTLGAGTGALAFSFSGTGAEVIAGQAINF